MLIGEWTTVLDGCLRRIGTWHVPPNYSAADWREEMRAHGIAAAWQALCDYDPARGVPLPAFMHQRVMGSALTRYRQEWSYARRCVSKDEELKLESQAADGFPCSIVEESLRQALAWLPERDRRLLEQLFFEERTEVEVARVLGVSQPVVSKRKQAVLHSLRVWVEITEK